MEAPCFATSAAVNAWNNFGLRLQPLCPPAAPLQMKFASDPSNAASEDVQHPQLVQVRRLLHAAPSWHPGSYAPGCCLSASPAFINIVAHTSTPLLTRGCRRAGAANSRQARHIQVRCACTPTYKICHRLRILLPLRPRTPVAPCPHPLPHLPSPSPCPPPAATH